VGHLVPHTILHNTHTSEIRTPLLVYLPHHHNVVDDDEVIDIMCVVQDLV